MANLPVISYGLLIVLFALLSTPAAAASMRWISVREVYADGAHNAWPDMCRWQGRYYIAFASSGGGHAEGHGVIVLSSTDGDDWQVETTIDKQSWKIRPNESMTAMTVFFLPTPERLHMVFWSRINDKSMADLPADKKDELKKQWLAHGGEPAGFDRWIQHHAQLHLTGVAYTEDGKTWSKAQPLLPERWWMWRPATYEGRHYMVAYYNQGQQWQMTDELKQMIPLAHKKHPDHPKRAHLVEYFQHAALWVSDDALKWQKHSDIAVDDNDETGLEFGPGGRLVAVSRIDAGSLDAIAYVAEPPYTKWRRLELSESIDQPAVLYHRGRWIVGGRYRDESTWTTPNRFNPKTNEGRIGTRLWWLNDETGELTTGTSLPSWGDCGQPAMVATPEGDLLVAYYSCSQRTDENRPVGGGPFPGKYSPNSIYVARVVVE